VNFDEIGEDEDEPDEDKQLFRLNRLEKLKPFTSTPVLERSHSAASSKGALKKNLFADMDTLTPFKGPSTAVPVSSEAIESPFLFRAKKKANGAARGSPIVVQDPFRRALLASHHTNALKENLRRENFQLSSQVPLASQLSSASSCGGASMSARVVLHDPVKNALLRHLNDTSSPDRKQIVKRVPITGKRLEELKRLRQDSTVIDDPIKKRLKLVK
jgi:hypothetical protein